MARMTIACSQVAGGQEVVPKRPTFLSSPLYQLPYLLFPLSRYIPPYLSCGSLDRSFAPCLVNPFGLSLPRAFNV